MDEYKKFEIISKRNNKKYEIVVLIKDHAFKRLAERAVVPDSNKEFINCIEKAAQRIVDDYPEILPGNYIIKSQSIGLKFPLSVFNPINNTINMRIPTVLTMSMSKKRTRYNPALTFEDFYFNLDSKEIIVE